jgi:hypothetical protein
MPFLRFIERKEGIAKAELIYRYKKGVSVNSTTD